MSETCVLVVLASILLLTAFLEVNAITSKGRTCSTGWTTTIFACGWDFNHYVLIPEKTLQHQIVSCDIPLGSLSSMVRTCPHWTTKSLPPNKLNSLFHGASKESEPRRINHSQLMTHGFQYLVRLIWIQLKPLFSGDQSPPQTTWKSPGLSLLIWTCNLSSSYPWRITKC